MKRKFKTMDANEAVAYVAYRVNEVIAIYPITPSSPMGEWADQWAAESVPNIWARFRTWLRCRARGEPRGPCTVRCKPDRWRRPSPLRRDRSEERRVGKECRS